MDKIEAQNQLKLSKVKIAKLEKQLQRYKAKAETDYEVKIAKYKETHIKGRLMEYKAILRRRIRKGAEKYLADIRTEKAIIKNCLRVINAKQVQLDVVEPIDIQAELPLIQKNLLASIKGLAMTDEGYYLHDGIEYKLIEVTNSKRRGSTVVAFEPIKIRSNKNITESVEIKGKPIQCILYRGYYILRHDGFNNINHKMTQEEEQLNKKYYYNFYYRNRIKVKRQENKKETDWL